MTKDSAPLIPRLMLIDDSEIDQMIYARIARRSGLVGELLQFHDGTPALSYLCDTANPRPDLILLDVNMPRMNGFEFLEAATQTPGLVLSPVVVMLTTSLNPRDRQRAESFAVVRDFLNKPLTVAHLQSLAALVGGPGG